MKKEINNFLFKCFIILNYNHLSLKAKNGKPYYSKIIKLKGFRTAVIENCYGNRSTHRFYWRVGNFYF